MKQVLSPLGTKVIPDQRVVGIRSRRALRHFFGNISIEQSAKRNANRATVVSPSVSCCISVSMALRTSDSDRNSLLSYVLVLSFLFPYSWM